MGQQALTEYVHIQVTSAVPAVPEQALDLSDTIFCPAIGRLVESCRFEGLDEHFSAPPLNLC